MKKRYKWWIILGIFLLFAGIGWSMQSKTDRQLQMGDTKHVTEDSEEESTQVVEEQEADKTTTEEKQETFTTAMELDHTTPVQEINPDMYEWPHGNTRYSWYKEPDMVIYLAQRKELFDEIATTFQKYEGRDIYGIVGWDEEEQMVYYEPMFSEDVIAIYDKYEKFFRGGIVSSIDVNGDMVSFEAVQNSHEYLHYYYDENRDEKTDEFLKDNNIVHVAPHWWWQEPVDPH